MKIVDIVTNDMHMLHGANRVTEKLIQGKENFASNGILLRYVVSKDGILDCQKYNESTLGKGMDSQQYKVRRGIIEKLKELPFYKSYIIQSELIRNMIKSNRSTYNAYKHIKDIADLIIFQDPFTAIYFLDKIQFNLKSIFISHAAEDPLEQLLMSRPIIRGSKTEQKLRKQYEMLFKSVNQVVTICGSSQKYMEDNYELQCPKIINGIEDIDVKLNKKYSISDGNIHIVIVASVQYRKGQDIAVKALGMLSKNKRDKIRLHIIGGGDGLSGLKNLIEKLSLENNVKIYGPVLNVEDYLPCMDCFLLPSRADTVPLAIIEAMRAQLPIFATNKGEIPEMIHGCGDLIEASDKSVFKLYNDLLEGKYDLIELGRKSRSKYVSEYGISVMINKYADIINSILNQN